jgi:hypothetical protein
LAAGFFAAFFLAAGFFAARFAAGLRAGALRLAAGFFAVFFAADFLAGAFFLAAGFFFAAAFFIAIASYSYDINESTQRTSRCDYQTRRSCRLKGTRPRVLQFHAHPVPGCKKGRGLGA